jgi:hypothetical protein
MLAHTPYSPQPADCCWVDAKVKKYFLERGVTDFQRFAEKLGLNLNLNRA